LQAHFTSGACFLAKVYADPPHYEARVRPKAVSSDAVKA
jgi:hypothetical protein